jgi:ubiquinone/menaquinone biosynthesis C-methylase UbiE
MPTIVLMKAFERNPAVYNLGMRLVTFGKIDLLHQEIADSIPPFSKLLDLGCGTGKILPALARKGVSVSAIDKSAEMVELAVERATREGVSQSVRINRNTLMEADRLYQDGEFDFVVLSLVISELTPDEQRWILKQCARVLKPSGLLLIADEFRPDSFLKRMASGMIRLPLHFIAYLYTQVKGLHTTSIWWKIYYTIVELPLILISFLVSEPLTRPIGKIERLLPTDLEIASTIGFLGGSVRLLKIKRADP